MTQLLFGLTVVFVVYVIYEVFKTVSQPGASRPSAASVAVKTPVAASVAAKPAPAASTSNRKGTPVKQAPARQASAPPPVAAPSPAPEGSGQLKNPQTGEVSSAPTNYRFAKKWVKDALVSEGLLDRVYKPAELDDDAQQKVKDALDKFRVLPKYQA